MRQIHRAALRPQQGAAEFRPCVLQAGYFQGDPEHGTSREGLEEHILIYCVSGHGAFPTDRAMPTRPRPRIPAPSIGCTSPTRAGGFRGCF